MLPNDDFKSGTVESSPPDFLQPITYVGLGKWNPPLTGWAIPVTYDFITADSVEEEVKARGTDGAVASYSVQLTQTLIYDFGFVYNLSFDDSYFYRRIHLFSFIRTKASAARCNFERFVTPQGEAFELVIHVYDDNANELSLGSVESFSWQMRDSDGALVTKTLDDENVSISDNKVYVLVEPDEIDSVSGIFQHEAQMVYESYLYTLFHGDAEIRSMWHVS